MTRGALAVLVLLCCAGCSKPEPPRRTAPWLASASASAQAGAPGNSGPAAFHFLPDSRIRFTIPGKKAKVTGQVPLATGQLRVDPRDLKTASVSIDADLNRLSIDADTLPEGVELGGSTPSALALQWLELGPGIAAERRRELSIARFELSSVESASAAGLDWGGQRGQSHVRATVVGTLLIHGFRAPVRTEVVLTPLATPPGAARRLSIRSASALVIDLTPHDIGARAPTGVVDALSRARSADWIGKHARIEVELVAEADEPSAK